MYRRFFMGARLCIAMYGIKIALYLNVSTHVADMPIYKLLSSFLCRVAIILETPAVRGCHPPGIDCIEYFATHQAFLFSIGRTSGPRIITHMETAAHILVVDDDHEIRTLLAEYLDANGFRTLMATNGNDMRKILSEARVDLVVLDLTLPGEDGLTLCRNLRADSNIPVIMLTARGEPLDRILGLEMGADDYLSKPFEPRELFARIRSVLRRTQALPPNMASPEAQQIQFGRWTLDLIARHLVNNEGLVVALSGAEYRILKVFLDHPNRVLNRDQLLELTQGRESDPFDRSVDIQISRLRQKLGDDARTPVIIKTVRNEGYVLATAVTVES
ncbi:Two-component response regulator [Collimonas fungivorans Ter331]|uniref:Two-component response regulator n=2 Tax=Collimonas fungivorans TaxID=158899 RepID=G0AJ85_COLFT|nr:Two-component response regulator [Collimonas fungivorans Ter331]